MRPRAVGGFEPDDLEQLELSELYRTARTALSGQSNTRGDRIRWAVDQFLVAHGGEPGVARKWVYVWAVENLGMITTGPPVQSDVVFDIKPARRRRSRR